MKKFLICFTILSLSVLQSCQDPLEIDIRNYENKLVADGWIEHNQYPVVVLTKSASYFSTIDSASLRNLVATRAKVTVSDGEKEEVLTLKKNTLFYPPYIYQGTEIKGEAGKKYFLTIEADGKKYEAVTSIPQSTQIDSLWFSIKAGDDSLRLLQGRFTDNGATEDYYRVFTMRKGKDSKFVPVYLSAIGDQFFNGQSFTFSLLRGSESLSDTKDDVYFRKGDTVMVKLCTIDRTHFDFWRTLERELYVTGNPFSSSGNEIKSNISGGALGVWGGYNPLIYQLIVK